MKKALSLIIATALLPLTACSGKLPAASPTDEPAPDRIGTGIEHVVIVGVDGGGTFLKEAGTPNLDKIMAGGAVTYDCLTSNPTISAQCWGSMLHGVTPEFHRLTNGILGSQEFPPDSVFPSVFRIIRENMPDADLASFCNWNPINLGIIENGLGVTKATANDAALTDMICNYLTDHDPTLLFIQFDEVDGAGHRNGYGTKGHLKQLETTDGYIGRIHETLEKRGLLDSTLFIVTADHGGTNDGGKGSHGGLSDAEKYVMFAAKGPSVEPGIIKDMEVRDVPAIVLYALGLSSMQPETWTARVPSGLFKGVEASERKTYTVQYVFEHRTHESVLTPQLNDSPAALLGADRVRAYFTFDGNTDDALGRIDSKANGKLYFVDNGYFGKAAKFDDGCVSISDLKFAKKSFSVAFWMKSGGVNGDPALISNKDWASGNNPGFVLSLRQNDVKFNFGDNAHRMDFECPLPFDYVDGWVYVVLVIDREVNEVRISYDFGSFAKMAIPEALRNASMDGLPVVNIGQDGTGKYPSSLTAELDELLIIDGVLTADDLQSLKKAYAEGS